MMGSRAVYGSTGTLCCGSVLGLVARLLTLCGTWSCKGGIYIDGAYVLSCAAVDSTIGCYLVTSRC